MTQQIIETNNHLNEFLQDSYKLEVQLEKKGSYKLASQVRRTTSVIARWVIFITGLDNALKEFWKDKERMGRSVN